MEYRQIQIEDAKFLTEIFSIPEYDLYFAENETSEQDWEERIPLFSDVPSFIVSDGNKDVGWIMYNIEDQVCFIDIIVLLPPERRKGYGKTIMQDILNCNPEICIFKLDVQQRNLPAIAFYKGLGFQIVSEEYQPVGEGKELYYNMQFNRYSVPHGIHTAISGGERTAEGCAINDNVLK